MKVKKKNTASESATRVKTNRFLLDTRLSLLAWGHVRLLRAFVFHIVFMIVILKI